MPKYNMIVIGAGASGMMSAIVSARQNRRVLLLEKLPKIATKLKATGGGRCNLSNTLDNETFMSHFGREGRFMTPALEALDYHALQDFFREIGVETHAPDGFRIFPVGHNASTIINALEAEMRRVGVEIQCSQKVEALICEEVSNSRVGFSRQEQEKHIKGVKTTTDTFEADTIIIATGGKGYPILGAEGDGYQLAESVGHKITEIHPAMMPLKTRETWGANCRADTLAKVEMRVDLKKYQKLHANGDLIFTKNGIRGPVVLDFSREITPLLAKFDEVPILLNMTKGMNEEQIRHHLKEEQQRESNPNTLSLLKSLLPESVAMELCHLAQANPQTALGKLSGAIRDQLIKYLVWTPLTITGHDGFKMAMITRGGISLKEINPKSLESKKIKGLYFCGEVMNLDGPCGGYNLQWAFSSGYLAGLGFVDG